MKFCHSCGMVLHEAREAYCQYCSDEQGNLLPREQVKIGIAQWLKSWAPEEPQADFVKRADLYMKAMPAWAEQ